MNNRLLSSLQLTGFLSFGPKSEPVELKPLNVLIGPNGVGKSNFIEAVELLHATPMNLSGAIRLGGRPSDWIWQGGKDTASARIEAVLSAADTPELRYGLEFVETAGRLEIVDEFLEEPDKLAPVPSDTPFAYRFQRGRPVIRIARAERQLQRDTIDLEQSILSQRKDPDLYPELTAVAKRFADIQIFREWSFGRSAALRAAQPANLPNDVLLPQLVNLGLVLNDLEHRNEWSRFNELMRKFLPRFSRLSTKVSAGAVQIFLHEEGLNAPVPATRLSDGTLRFVALLAILLNPQSAPLICIEEPELGVHPDALSLLVELLVEASETTQLIVTTHSDVLVSALTEETESVLVCDYAGNGTELRRLERAKLTHWLDKYRLGEVWRRGELGGNLW